MDLIIVESPKKAKTITHYLKNKYRVLASFGHVIDLPKKGLGIDIDRHLPTKIVDYVDNSYFKRSSPIFTTFPAPIVINKSPFIHFSLKKSSISAKEGK